MTTPTAGEVLAGAVAGLVATGPMTAAMNGLYRRLPESDRYALPPRLLTDRVLAPDSGGERLPAERRADLALAAHYAYGAATGSLFPLAARHLGQSPAMAGAAYGVLVWTASYLGWVPASGVLTPATRHSARRNGLMIAAHLVWGAALGVMFQELRRRPESFTAIVPPRAPEVPRRAGATRAPVLKRRQPLPT